MNSYKVDRDKERDIKVTTTDIPKKLNKFGEFVSHMENVMLQGTAKYTGAKIDTAETIDLMPMTVGEDGYVAFVICDILKRLIRFKNDRRERDLIKISVWCYLLYKYFQDKVDNEQTKV